MAENTPLDDLPVSSNPGQQNMDRVGATINDRVKQAMGVLPDTEPTGRHFLDNEHNLFGYNGVVVRDGRIVTLLSLAGDEDTPPINLDTEITIQGDSHGYVSSGHKPGDKVRVLGFIEPFFKAGKGIQSSDKIIQVQGGMGEDGAEVIGWIKPSEFDKQLLKRQREEEMKKLFGSSKPEEV